MFKTVWGEREEERDIRQSHLNSLPRFPPKLIDRGASGDTPLTYASSAEVPKQSRGVRRPREETPRSAPESRGEASPEEEEGLRPRQKRRTSPRRPAEDLPRDFPEDTSAPLSPTSPASEEVLEAVPLAAQPASGSTPVEPSPVDDGRDTPAAEPEVNSKSPGASWLQPGFELPTEAEDFKSLAMEIVERTPPLTNLRFNNPYVAALVGEAILERAHDPSSLAGMSEMSVEEATNRLGALFARASSLALHISRSRANKQTEQAAADAEWRRVNEPRLLSLEQEVSKQAALVESLTVEKQYYVHETEERRRLMAGLKTEVSELTIIKRSLLEERAKLKSDRDEAVASRQSLQEELDQCRSEDFKRKIIDDFKKSSEYHLEVSREASSFMDKGCIHVIRQLHPYFEDKSVLLQSFKSNFDNDFCRQGADFVPYTSEELEALRERDERKGKPVWTPPQPSTPTFWDLLGEGPSSAAPGSSSAAP